MILDLVITLIVVAIVGVVLIGLLAPLESLGWWAGWSGQPARRAEPTASLAHQVVVYLSGIGSISGDELLQEEAEFLDHLEPLLPDTVIVRDVFPYSVTGVGLTGARTFAGLWQLLGRMRLQGDVLLSSLINVRNLFQVAVAADPRYGPMFSCGVAQVIADRVTAVGYVANVSRPLVLLGYSGGAQVAVGAAPFLRDMLGASVHVISLGGVLDSHPAMCMLARLDHIIGENDTTERLGRIVYPGRWRVSATSAWNKARREGVVHIQKLHGMRHNTPGGYMDPEARAINDELNPVVTARTIASLVWPG